ncbi:autotransporter assembly complex family protein [Fluviibacterium sp. DFM31]|uniref:Autotransporter assembly complex family protein n=1 Tax=Meridianimarinicoccus marinus TaxID=3231483 RepID=A0ABV3L764_9RHOB
MRRLVVNTLTMAVLAVPALAFDSVTVTVSGIADEDKREAIEKRLKSVALTSQALEQEESDAAVIFGSARSDYSRMVSVMYGEGYYGPSVSVKIDGREAADIDPFTLPKSIDKVTIAVEAGPQFTFGKTQVGPRAPTANANPIVEGFVPGAVAQANLVVSAAKAGVQEWKVDGHAKASVKDQTIIANHPKRQLNAEVVLAPGPLLRFGSLSIDGERNVSNKRVRQIMGFPEGEVYNPDELRDAVNRVRRTGTFSTVSVREAETPNPDGTLDYQMTLIEEKPRRFGLLAEYDTLDGFTVGGYWIHRNLFGGAERLRIDAEAANIGSDKLSDAGGIDYTASLRLTRPGSFGHDNDAFFFATYEDTNDPDYTEEAFSFGVGVTRYFNEDLFGQVAGGLRYSHSVDVFGDREFYHAILPARLEWDKRDDPGDATRGFYLDTLATPYLGLDDSQSGMVATVDARTYHGFGESKSFVMAGRLLLGTVVGSDLDQTPPDFLFFSGGADTVRGQKYKSLGVDVGASEQSGGRSFVGVSAEARYWVTSTIGVVGFADFGFVGPDSYPTDAGDSQSGLGIGVRYATPIGPLRVDLATPYTGQVKEFSRVALYIGVGQAF